MINIGRIFSPSTPLLPLVRMHGRSHDLRLKLPAARRARSPRALRG
jgi:hypothetical protein